MQDLASHFSTLAGPQSRLSTSVFTFLMNKKSYEKLSAENKKVIDSLSGRNIAEWAGQNWIDIETPGKKVMESKSKNKFYVIPTAEVEKIRAAAKPAIAKWIEEMNDKGYKGQELYDDAVAMVDKYTKKMN